MWDSPAFSATVFPAFSAFVVAVFTGSMLWRSLSPPRGPRVRPPLQVLVEPVEHDGIAELLHARLRVDPVVLALDPHELRLTPEHAERREQLLGFRRHHVRV